MKSLNDELREAKVSVLQLQRSALLDTQTIMQLMLDKGICDASEIVETRMKIEEESPDVKRINEAILEAGGEIEKIPELTGLTERDKAQKTLDKLEYLLKEMSTRVHLQ